MRLDLVINNARIRTMDPDRPLATRVGVLHGRVAALDEDIADLAARQIIDLRGQTLLPGFVDAHNHLAWAGLAAGSVDLSKAHTVDEALTEIAGAVAQTTTDGWVDVVGYDQRPLGRHLTRDDLDSVAAGRKIFVIHTSGHAHLVSSAVLDLMPQPPNPGQHPGVVVGDSGRPTGLFLEGATAIVNAIRMPYSLSELKRAVSRAAHTCAAQGITFVAEAGIGGGLSSRSPIEALAYQDAIADGEFPVRAQLMTSLDALETTRAHSNDGIDRALSLGLRTGFGSSRLSLGAAKAWLDGGMMARTAALTEPYVGDPTGSRGELSPDLDGIADAACAAHAAGWQLALHAIGDRAIDAALEIVEQAQHRRPRRYPRHRIEHCGLVRPDQLPRLAAAGVTAVVQPSFLYEFGDDYATVMGHERAGWMYRGRSFLDHGIPLAGSSDRPVADGAPLRAIQFMVQRLSSSGAGIGADEAVSVADALHAYTMGSATACGVEDRLGSITPGKLADFNILAADPEQVAASELADISVTGTVVGGELVHGTWSER